MFTTELFKAYSQWEGNKMKTDPPRGKTEKYWKDIWEKEASHNTNDWWLVDLREDHSPLPEQDPVNNTMGGIQESLIAPAILHWPEQPPPDRHKWVPIQKWKK